METIKPHLTSSLLGGEHFMTDTLAHEVADWQVLWDTPSCRIHADFNKSPEARKIGFRETKLLSRTTAHTIRHQGGVDSQSTEILAVDASQ